MNTEERQLAEMLHRVTPEPPRRVSKRWAEERGIREMLRSAMRQDEWLLLLHGAVLGIFGGAAHLVLFA